MLPFILDNATHHTADALRTLLSTGRGSPVDIATAYFSVSGYRLLKDGLDGVGAFRLLLGQEPSEGEQVGLRSRSVEALSGELGAASLDEPTMRLVEDLIAYLREDKVAVRLYDKAFLHAKAYIFHHDRVGPGSLRDRLRPFAAVVGSSNFTGPGLTSNRELNLVHRVYTEEDPATDPEAAERSEYLRELGRVEQGPDLFDRSTAPREELPRTGLFDDRVSPAERRLIKSEVGARAVMELERWFQRHWDEARDFKDELIDLINRSKFGQHPYSPYEIYMKALYEYLRDQLDASDQFLFGKTAVDLAEFQEDSVRRARRILQRYDGVLIADSVGLGKTWIGKRLLEDFAYHRRQKALVVCPASLRPMWTRELREATISAAILGMEEMGREEFDPRPFADADVVLVDESHNFRSSTANRYLALDDLIQRNGGRGRDGERKKVILLSATPINNDLFDLFNQVRLFTQGEADYFREAGIGDLTNYFRAARRAAKSGHGSPGELLFNLLDEFVVRNTRPHIRIAYPNATIRGEAVSFPERTLRTLEYSLAEVWGGTELYQHIVDQIGALSLAPYTLEQYRKREFQDENSKFEQGREAGLVGIFKTRFLKRLESSIEAFRLSVNRAIAFERVYLDLLGRGRVIASRDFWKMLRIAGIDSEDDLGADTLAEELISDRAVRAYLESLENAPIKQYRVGDLAKAVETDIHILEDLHDKIKPLVGRDTKLDTLKRLLATELKGRKVLVFTSYKDTAQYLESGLRDPAWLAAAGDPHVRRIDSRNHPTERMGIVASFAPKAMEGAAEPTGPEIDVLISTDVLSEGQNLQDCGVMINYDLTWNPIRLVQRSGRIDRLRSPHKQIQVWNMFPERELEDLLKLVARLCDRISQIDDLGMLDASVLGEVVHPRTFNSLRRIKDGEVSALDEEEERAELAGPELLLKSLREMLNREGAQSVVDLPDGIHSGLRRGRHDGMFFHFRAGLPDGTHRHFWRFVDAATGRITDNRFEIARMIACGPGEPRYIGDQKLFELQDRVIERIVSGEEALKTRQVISAAGDPIQQAIAEDLKAALRRGSIDRERMKAVLPFLGQGVGKAVVLRLRSVRKAWEESGDDAALLDAVGALSVEYAKAQAGAGSCVDRDELELVCFDFVSPA